MEQNKDMVFCSSLPVPSVQELAKKPLTVVPERYIRANQVDSPVTNHHKKTPLPEFPVIDMRELLLPSEVGSQELQKLHSACKEWGFFKVINHGVSSEVVEKAKVEVEGLFQLSMEEKKQLSQRDGDMNGNRSLIGEISFTSIHSPFTSENHTSFLSSLNLSEAIDEYCKGVRDLEMKILMSMAKALKMEEKDMRKLFEEGVQGIKMNYYPPCPQPELVTGLSPHSDAVGLTMLLPANDTEGLQVKKDEMWITVKPIPDAFVINVGDILEMVTNGIYRSIEHRVIANSTKERLSIVAFHNPKLDGDMGPAPSLITPQTPAIFRRTAVIDYFKGLGPLHLRDKSTYSI